MIKKIFTSILVLNIILINIAINFLVPKIEINLELTKKVVDIKNTNDLINTYSNLLMEIGPANE